MQRKVTAAVFFTVVFAVLAGCATTKTTTELTAFHGDFAKYPSVGIEFVPNAKVDQDLHPETFPNFLRTILTKQKGFKRIASGSEASRADLIAKVEVTSIDSPGALGTMFAGTTVSAEVKVKCHFIDAKSKRPLAALETTGNSKNMGRSSVGGIGVTGGQSHTNRAYENAAEAIADYIAKHHTGLAAAAK